MAIRINKLSVYNLGPIEKLNLSFKDVNLIFGVNESGKTFLIEFLIKSLFKDTRGFNLRSFPGNGLIEVDGFDDNSRDFSPDSKNKRLEDFISSDKTKLPKDLSKLLVVRAGELEFDDSPDGVGENIIKKYLSNEFVLDQIRNNFSASIKSASFENGEINGKKTGEIKKKNEIENEFRATLELLNEVNLLYSEGEIQTLRTIFVEKEKLYKTYYENSCKLAYKTNNRNCELFSIDQKLKDEIANHYKHIRNYIYHLQSQNIKIKQEQSSILACLHSEISFLNREIENEKEKIGKIAFALDNKKKKLEENLKIVNLQLVEHLTAEANKYIEINKKIENHQIDNDELEIQLASYKWIDDSIEIYQQCLGNKDEKEINKKLWPSWLLPIIIYCLIFLSIILLFFINTQSTAQFLLFTAFLLIGILITFNTIMESKTKKNLQEKILSNTALHEIDAIRQHYSELMDINVSQVDLPLLRAKRDKLRELEILKKNIEQELLTKSEELEKIKNTIETNFIKNNIHTSSSSDWNNGISLLSEKANQFINDYNKINAFYDSLQINKDSFIYSEYVSDSYEVLTTQYSNIQIKIKDLSSEIDKRHLFLNQEGIDIKVFPIIDKNEIQVFQKWQDEYHELKNKLQEQTNEINVLENFISDIKKENSNNEVFDYDVSEFDFNSIKQKIFYAQNLIKKYDEEINQNLIKLAELNVNEVDYVVCQDSETINFEIESLKKINEEMVSLSEHIKAEEQEVENLRLKLIGAVNGRISDSFEKLIDILMNKKQLLSNELDKINSQIIAGILVNQTICELANNERETIKLTLNSPLITKPLFKLTGRYKNYFLDETGLCVKDDFNIFPIKNISTGTREQILLSLRLGFAANLLKTEKMFLLLDDAFQHSDWNRRNNLINYVFDLAIEGWQIIYFTMDNHIKLLFDEKSKEYSCSYLSTSLEM
ncbi:MAG: AAA family ATPase [Anaerolineaceae bacterium]|nr:AAA family ATPase [Anaerolineaceae bacterium]